MKRRNMANPRFSFSPEILDPIDFPTKLPTAPIKVKINTNSQFIERSNSSNTAKC